MSFLVGETYKNKRGEQHFILKRSNLKTEYPLIALDSRQRLVAFRDNGRFEKTPSERDLVNGS